jgi:hypothetical protein
MKSVVTNFVIFLVPLTLVFVLIMKKDLPINHKIALIPYFIAVVTLTFSFLYYGSIGALRTVNDVLGIVVAPTLVIFIVSLLYPMYRILGGSKRE